MMYAEILQQLPMTNNKNLKIKGDFTNSTIATTWQCYLQVS